MEHPESSPDNQAARRTRRIAVISSFTPSLTNFRLELLKGMVRNGHEVTAFGPEYDEAVITDLKSIGVGFVQIPMARTGTGAFSDLKTMWALWRELRRLMPDTVLPYTMKPVIYGCLAARLVGVPHRFALMTGLGHVFASSDPRGKDAAIRRISIWLYRLALGGAERIFVYNDADERDIRRHRMIADMSRLTMVSGSGVDLDRFVRSDPPPGPPVFLLMARLLRDKGICEFAEAARTVKSRFPEARMQLLGQFESHASGIAREQIDGWEKQGIVEYLGETRDVRPYLARCSVFVLPSYYREGIPRSILEAMATGRAIITADTPGCRDTVIDGHNGMIVAPRDANSLAQAMTRFLEQPQLIGEMGRRSFEVARDRFDVRLVNKLLLEKMQL